MKTIGILVLVALFLGLSGFQANDKKEKKAKARLEMAQLIQNGRFRFVARSANSELGNFNNLSSNYDLVFDSLQVKAYLPYYGRAYSVPYGGSGGVDFDLTAKSIDRKWNKRKKMFTISTELADSEDSYYIYLTAGLDGYADLKINFRNRRLINYSGTIEKIEIKNK
ncbi:MAG TPA: DUF4251 domain-containing protein [Prolixibacteraceae bacterium]|nr:DUF4251 domain-containing protein [Prolixibacteraceae bacterium]